MGSRITRKQKRLPGNRTGAVEGRVKASGKTSGAMGLAHILEARQRKEGK